jgi:hypothetical protein
MPTYNHYVKVSFIFEVEAENEEAARKEAFEFESYTSEEEIVSVHVYQS